MRGKYIVPTRTYRVCSLLRFDGKKWCFSRLSDQFKPLPFPDRSFFQLVQTVCVHTMTGPSHAACNIGRDLHFRLDRYRDAALLYCMHITAVKIFHSTVATAAQLAVHKDSSAVRRVRRQLNPPATFLSILSRNVQLSTNDGAFARRLNVKRYAHDRREKFGTPKSIFFTCPNISHVWKLEKPTTTTLNSKKER